MLMNMLCCWTARRVLKKEQKRTCAEADRPEPVSARIVGQATEVWLDSDGDSSAAIAFATALNQSFGEQYSVFNLLVQLSAPVAAVSAASTPSAGEHRWLSTIIAQ
jgi:hypothetical protein